jgi:hypothetical protein
MTWPRRSEGPPVNGTRTRRRMRRMGRVPICQVPDTSRPAKGHKTSPYLLRGLQVARPNPVWCAGIPYIPRKRGFLYLVAIMDWHSRKVLAGRLSNIEPWSAIGSRTMARGGRRLRRGAERGHPPVRRTGYHEHRPRIAVHVVCRDRPAETGRPPSLNGRQGARHRHPSGIPSDQWPSCPRSSSASGGP